MRILVVDDHLVVREGLQLILNMEEDLSVVGEAADGSTAVRLTGELQPWVSAKDVVLKMLERFSTKGNVGWVIEYAGPGVAALTVPERATITNMGAEMGVTTSLFPSDAATRRFL